jgi:hypothetical protein
MELYMNANLHSMSSLFAQLGLLSEPTAIEDFIATHRPLGDGIEVGWKKWSPTDRVI